MKKNYSYSKYFKDILQYILYAPLLLAVLFGVFLSALVFIIDQASVEMKAINKMRKDLEIVVADKLVSVVQEQRQLYFNSTRTYLFSDTTIVIPEYGINTTDTSSQYSDFLVGYINVSNIFMKPDSIISLDESDILECSHKIITSEKDSAAILNEILHIIKTHRYFTDTDYQPCTQQNIFFNVNSNNLDKYWLYFILNFDRVGILGYPILNYVSFIGFSKQKIADTINKYVQDDIKYTIEMKTYFENDSTAINYLIGNENIKTEILSRKYNIQDTFNFATDTDEIITMSLTDKSIRGLYTFWPTAYIIILIMSIIMYFIFKYFINRIKSKEQLLKEQNESLLVANNTKDKFFSIIAHDLRNPIVAMTNISAVFNDHYHIMSPEDSKKSISILVKSTTHISKLLENLLQWSRLCIDGIKLNLAPNRIDLIVKTTFEDVEAQAQSKNITLKLENKTTNDVYCDASMVNTILRNLISNAIKFSNNDKSIYVIIDDYIENKNYIVVNVKDEGIGMNTDTLNKLFRLDTKVTNTGTAGEGGTGLGLILCKEFIDKHDCKIWVESKIGVGTTFKFTLLKYKDNS